MVLIYVLEFITNMGNTISPESRESMRDLASKIFSIECPILDIGSREGFTGYIDFIRQDELTGPIAKGTDYAGRNFIVWRADCVLNSNNTESKYSTFTTFFKRYSDFDSVLYHTCGHGGHNLFSTEGGCTQSQMEFLLKLLETKNLTINKEQMDEYRIIPNDWNIKLSDDATLQIIVK